MYDNFLGQLSRSLDIAWSNIGNSSGDLDLPDIINYADVRASWDEYRSRVINDFQAGACFPSSVEVVDLPKDRISVRPLARLGLSHRLIYEASVVAAANRIEAVIPRPVYSYRWWSREQRFLAPKSSWMRMQKAARKVHKMNPSLMLASSDVTAFYENIDVDTLRNDLGPLRIPEWSREAIGGFLEAFNGLSNVWGLPQGSNMSGLLANLYLTTLDAEIRRNGLRYFRYSDDFYVFGADWQELREIIVGANRVLRHRHLNLSGPKTRIIENGAIAGYFEDIEKDAISYGVRIRNSSAHADVHEFFDRATECDEISVRDVRFVLGQLAELQDSYAVDWITGNLHRIPHSTREACLYLELAAKPDRRLIKAIADLLLSPTLTAYSYSQHHILIYMIRNGISSRDALDGAWNILLDRSKESFVREMAARYLGIHGLPGEVSRLKQEYQTESDARVQRALLVACYESNQCFDRWLSIATSSDSAPHWTIQYLRRKPASIPLPIIQEPGWH